MNDVVRSGGDAHEPKFLVDSGSKRAACLYLKAAARTYTHHLHRQLISKQIDRVRNKDR